MYISGCCCVVFKAWIIRKNKRRICTNLRGVVVIALRGGVWVVVSSNSFRVWWDFVQPSLSPAAQSWEPSFIHFTDESLRVLF